MVGGDGDNLVIALCVSVCVVLKLFIKRFDCIFFASTSRCCGEEPLAV